MRWVVEDIPALMRIIAEFGEGRKIWTFFWTGFTTIEEEDVVVSEAERRNVGDCRSRRVVGVDRGSKMINKVPMRERIIAKGVGKREFRLRACFRS